MKAKKLYHSIWQILLLAAITSCDNYLDLSPVSSYNAESAYTTQQDFELSVNGIYDEFQKLSDYYVPVVIESRSDNISAISPYVSIYDEVKASQFIDDASNDVLANIWEGYWKIIDRSNAVLDNIESGEFDDEEYRSYYKGEAYFLRGYSYFQLGWMYGGVPLIDHQMTVDEIYQTARSTQDETFEFAASDLLQAINLLPEEWASAELGKATKYAAEGILVRLYMFQKEYSKAKTYLSDIISSGKYQMAENYKDCFTDEYDNSAEHVFQVQYISGSLGEGNEFPATCVPEDIRSDLFSTGGNSHAMPVSEDLYESYEEGDLRHDFTIMKGYTSSTGEINTTSLYYIKFAHGTVPSDKADYEVNMPILRYTDVKLMYAEILNEEGYDSGGEAFSILNAVRDRAGLDPLSSVEVPDQDAFRTAMLKERRLEFACEYLRWFDLIRTGNAYSVMNTFLKRSDEGNGSYQMQDYQTLFAIPQKELDSNPNTDYMWQNTGY